MIPFQHLGFIGLGVMGEPMCRNLIHKTGLPTTVFDLDPAPVARLVDAQSNLQANVLNGAQSNTRTNTPTDPQASRLVHPAGSTAAVMQAADLIFLSLPSGEIVDQVIQGPQGLLAKARAGQTIVDLSTSPVELTRDWARAFATLGVEFIDAPVARTRAAAESGTLSIMVGASEAAFARVRPMLETFATDISLCGPVGCGQVVKIMNNMILFETVVAISEAKAIAERAGVPADVLFGTLSKGSADSFALRNHGMKAVLPDEFPERAFSVRYARKDLRYALDLAKSTGVDARSARNVDQWFEQAINAGLGELYHPVISRLIGPAR